MEGFLTYWYLLPCSIVIATIAMASGVGGAVFFSPIFMIGLKLEVPTAVGAALITELFGFSSGFYAYVKAKLIDYNLGKSLLYFSVPAAIAGSLLGSLIDDRILKGVFAAGILFISWQLYQSYRQDIQDKNQNIAAKKQKGKHGSCLTDKDGNTYYYTIKNKGTGKLFAGLGGAFLGMISVGLAEILEYQLVARCKVPIRVAVATAIFVVVISVFAASISHAIHFINTADAQTFQKVGSIILFTVPGVIIGGQIGPWLQQKVNESKMKGAISVLFALVGVFMLGVVVFNK